MANETHLTLIGNLTGDPELRYTQAGKPVANFTIASTPQRYDRNQQQWVDGDTLFLRCSLWNGAENLCDSLRKGDRVIATGKLTQRSYQGRDGQNVTVTELQVDEVGASLKWVTASVQKPNRNNYNTGYQQQGHPQQQQQSAAVSYDQPAGGTTNDPWANAAPSQPPF